ncbi:hypothetical protein [Archaeoglobus sp.]
MIDPSLLVSESKFEEILEWVKQPSLDMAAEKYYVPASFVEVLYEVEPNFEVISYFKDGAKVIDLRYLRERLEKEKKLEQFKLMRDHLEKYSTFFEFLLINTKNDKIARILLEEWVFLQEKSLAISRIKKPFKEFVKAGAVCIEFGKRTLDYAVSRTVKKESDLLTTVDRLRAVAKWIAVGGPQILPLVDPLTKLVGLSTSFFLLFDP